VLSVLSLWQLVIVICYTDCIDCCSLSACIKVNYYYYVPAPVRLAAVDPLTLLAGLEEDEDRLEQDLVVLLFFVLPPSPRSDPVLPADLPAEDKLLELPESLPFIAGTHTVHHAPVLSS